MIKFLHEAFRLLDVWDVSYSDFEREGFWRRFLAVSAVGLGEESAGCGLCLADFSSGRRYCPCPKCCGKYSDGKTAGGRKIRR